MHCHCTDKPVVVWQSPTSITISSFRNEVALYCVASYHGSCTYHWKKFGRGRLTFPSSSVVYVNEGGVYQCAIKTEGIEEVFSRTIRVYANIGKVVCLEHHILATYILMYMNTFTYL